MASLLKLLAQGAHNIETNVKGAFNQINPFDSGKTYADAWRQPLTTQNLGYGLWSGAPGGDQQFNPIRQFVRGHDPGIQASPRPTPPLLHVAPPALQQLLSVGTNNQIQPSSSPEDGSPPSDFLQNLAYNNGQVTLNGSGIQGPLTSTPQYNGYIPVYRPPLTQSYINPRPVNKYQGNII